MRGFLRTTFIGGLVALLPISMVIILFRWIINLIERHLGPVIDLVTDTDSRLYTFGLYLAAIIIIFLVFFTIGLIIKTWRETPERVNQFLSQLLPFPLLRA
jgi:uncharacterized membrane protein